MLQMSLIALFHRFSWMTRLIVSTFSYALLVATTFGILVVELTEPLESLMLQPGFR